MLGKTTSLQIHTPEGVSFQIPIASPFSRCLALAIDFAIITALTVLFIQIITFLQIAGSGLPIIGDVISDFGNGFMIVMQFLISILYGILSEWLMSGQTFGKRVFRLRVVDERGFSLGFKQVVIRNLFRLLDILPSTFYLLGGISCFATSRCQRIGDIAAGTLVVRETDVAPPALDGLITAKENSFANVPHLEARLRQRTSPEEARIALDAIVRRDELEPARRLHLFAQLADYFRSISEFPEEISHGLSDEQYIRNVVETLFRRAGA